MRLIHIADLHLGKVLNDYPLLEDQRFVLDQILSIAEEVKADGLLIAGDVYQRSAPAAEAMALFDSFLSRLSALGLKAYIISGNHDSSLRVAYLSDLVREQGIHIAAPFSGSLQSVRVRDNSGEVVIYMLPFIHPSDVRPFYPEKKITSTEDAIRAILENTPVDPSARNILLCHQFVSGAVTTDSETPSIGGLDSVDASLFKDFDYVALGHLHRPQKVLRPTVRYAGSPLRYSFSETDHDKSLTILELGKKGEISLQTRPLYPVHQVNRVEGKLEELLRMDYTEDLVWVTVTDEMVPPDARITLRSVFPNMLRFTVSNSRTKLDMDILATEAMEDRSIPELFTDFFRLQNNQQDPTEPHLALLRSVLEELGGDEA